MGNHRQWCAARADRDGVILPPPRFSALLWFSSSEVTMFATSIQSLRSASLSACRWYVVSIDITVNPNGTAASSTPCLSPAVRRFTARPPTTGWPEASRRPPPSSASTPRELVRRTGSLTATALLRGRGRSLLLCAGPIVDAVRAEDAASQRTCIARTGSKDQRHKAKRTR